MNVEVNWGFFWYEWIWNWWPELYGTLERNTYNWKVWTDKQKWGCSVYTPEERWDVGNIYWFPNWYARWWMRLCIYKDRPIKLYTRIEAEEPENKVLEH